MEKDIKQMHLTNEINLGKNVPVINMNYFIIVWIIIFRFIWILANREIINFKTETIKIRNVKNRVRYKCNENRFMKTNRKKISITHLLLTWIESYLLLVEMFELSE